MTGVLIKFFIVQDDEMMSHDTYTENSAINLSTSQVSRGSNSATNGNGDSEDSQSSVRDNVIIYYYTLKQALSFSVRYGCSFTAKKLKNCYVKKFENKNP